MVANMCVVCVCVNTRVLNDVKLGVDSCSFCTQLLYGRLLRRIVSLCCVVLCWGVYVCVSTVRH